MTVSSTALAAETKAFNDVFKKIQPHSEILVKPAGFDAGFPDFAYRIHVRGKLVDVHIEYKADRTAQMGSIRDWIFDGKKFTVSTPDEEKDQLLEIMNGDSAAIENGRRLLKDFQEYADPSIKSIYSGMMGFEKDMTIRKSKLKNFATNTRDFQLKKIQDASIGRKIINHYEKKFNKAIRRDANLSVLLFMFKDTFYYVSAKGDMSLLKDAMGFMGNKNPQEIGNLQAKLEVRIQPRGLNSSSPARVDTIASMRLQGNPSGGWTL